MAAVQKIPPKLFTVGTHPPSKKGDEIFQKWL